METVAPPPGATPAEDPEVPARGNRLGRNISALTAAQAVTWATSLLTAFVVPRALGASAMGTLVTAASITGILGLVVGLVTTNYLLRELVQDPQGAGHIAGTALLLRLFAMPLFVGATAGYARVIGLSQYRTGIVVAIAVATGLNILADPFQAYFQSKERMHLIAVTTVVGSSGQGLLTLALVYLNLKLGSIVLGTICVAIATTGLNVSLARRYGLRIHLRPQFGQMWSMLRGSCPYVASNVVYLIYLYLDSIILATLAPSSVVGWYGVATRLFAALLVIPTIVTTAWLPRLVAANSLGRSALYTAAKPYMEFVLALSLPVGVGVFLVARPTIQVLYGSGFSGASPALAILGLTIIPMYAGMAVAQLFIAQGRPMVLTLMLLLGSAANGAFNLWLDPLMQHQHHNGAIGASLSLLLTEVTISSVGMLIAGRLTIHRGSLVRLLKVATATTAMAVTTIFSNAGFPWSASLGVAAFAFSFIALRVLTVDERTAILHRVRYIACCTCSRLSFLWERPRLGATAGAHEPAIRSRSEESGARAR